VLLPDKATILAPDEGNYAELASWVAYSKDVENYPGFGPNLYNSSRTFIVPAAGLIKLGLDELTSVRLISVFFGLLSIYYFMKIIFLILHIDTLEQLETTSSKRLLILTFVVFAFLPSSFLWSTLGLRESASKATILASAFYLVKIRNVAWESMGMRYKIPTVIFAILAIMLAFGGRKQTATLFVISFCLCLLIMSRGRLLIPLTATVSVGAVLGLLFSTTPATTASTRLVWVSPSNVTSEFSESKGATPAVSESKGATPAVSESKGATPAVSESKGATPAVSEKSNLGEGCGKLGQRVESEFGVQICASESILEKQVNVSSVLNQIPVKSIAELEKVREGNRLTARTGLAKSNCDSLSSSLVTSVVCNISELPYRLFSILFRPLPILDQGSHINNLASIENIFWIILFTLFGFALVNSLKSKRALTISIPTSLFVVSFSILAALYEGNLGTAFRHKSTILWGLLLVIVIGMNSHRRKTEEESQKENPRYAS
jgi:hypothetical protein